MSTPPTTTTTRFRESSAGGTSCQPSYRGSRFKVGPAGDRDRTTRVVVLAHRNNLEEGDEWTPLDGLD